jgi:hypothetical protein
MSNIYLKKTGGAKTLFPLNHNDMYIWNTCPWNYMAKMWLTYLLYIYIWNNKLFIFILLLYWNLHKVETCISPFVFDTNLLESMLFHVISLIFGRLAIPPIAGPGPRALHPTGWFASSISASDTGDVEKGGPRPLHESSVGSFTLVFLGGFILKTSHLVIDVIGGWTLPKSHWNHWWTNPNPLTIPGSHQVAL